MFLSKDKTLRMLERVTSTHRVGRVLKLVHDASQPSILVFAAHQDDDVLGVGVTIYRHVQEGNHVRVIFTSNGGGHHRSKRDLLAHARTRYTEACVALSQAGLSPQDVACLGFPDGRLFRYMNDMAVDVKRLIEQMKPRRVYVHAIEGGHRDHDVTGFVVQSVCKHMGYSEVYEWTEYNSLQTLVDDPVGFPVYPREIPYESVRLMFTAEEKTLKQTMLLTHKSQVVPMALNEYKGSSELVRRCKLDDLGTKLIDFWEYSIDMERLNSLTEDFQKCLRTYIADFVPKGRGEEF